MNPPSMEMMFLILSGVILAAGVLYWFWSHIQLTQKKVQLLENAVFELRGMVGMSGPSSSGPESNKVPEQDGTPAEYKDLDDDDWNDGTVKTETPQVPNPVFLSAMAPLPPPIMITRDDVKEVKEVKEEPKEEQFRELFVNDTGADAKPEENQTLEGLPLKELRRMATERGIAAAELKKKEVIAALRNTVTAPVPVSVPVSVPVPVDVEKMVEVTVLE